MLKTQGSDPLIAGFFLKRIDLEFGDFEWFFNSGVCLFLDAIGFLRTNFKYN